MTTDQDISEGARRVTVAAALLYASCTLKTKSIGVLGLFGEGFTPSSACSFFDGSHQNYRGRKGAVGCLIGVDRTDGGVFNEI
jgi:hypothetical protein